MQKVFLAMNALPWERLNIQDGPPQPDGTIKRVTAHGDYYNAGFLPVYWSEDAAKKANPGAKIQEAGVGDEWAKRPAPPANHMQPQGDQFAFDGLDKKGLIEKIAEVEAELVARGMEPVLLSLRGFILGETPANKAGKDKIQNYLQAIFKVSEIQRTRKEPEVQAPETPKAPARKPKAKSQAKSQAKAKPNRSAGEA